MSSFKTREQKQEAIKLVRQAIAKSEEKIRLLYELKGMLVRMPVTPELEKEETND